MPHRVPAHPRIEDDLAEQLVSGDGPGHDAAGQLDPDHRTHGTEPVGLFGDVTPEGIQQDGFGVHVMLLFVVCHRFQGIRVRVVVLLVAAVGGQ